MTVWNVFLVRRQLSIRVKKILRREPKFMVIIDTRGRQHELSEVDFPSFEWKEISVGSTITLTVSESVTRWRVKAAEVKKISGLYFFWVCEHCGIKGYVEYEDGDDPQVIAEHINSAHKKEAREDCKGNLRIFDHRGMEQRDSALLTSSRRVV